MAGDCQCQLVAQDARIRLTWQTNQSKNLFDLANEPTENSCEVGARLGVVRQVNEQASGFSRLLRGLIAVCQIAVGQITGN
jgi:hypothetical protein